jgi:putative MFS transporter
MITGLGYFLDGYNLTVIAVFTYILATYHMFSYSAFQMGMVSGSALLGAGIGATVFGMFSDRFGRRRLFLAYFIPFLLFPVLCALSVNINEVIAFRFLLGIGIGADYAIGPVYSIEMFPEESRGKGNVFIWAFWSLGASTAFITGYLALVTYGIDAWRIAFAVISVPALLLLILKLRLPESNDWKKMESERIKMTLEGDLKDPIRPEKKESSLALFRGELGFRTAIVWIPWILLDVGSYGFGLYGPLIIGGLGFHGPTIFLLTSLFYIVSFICAFASTPWNDRFGRKATQALGFGMMGLGLFLLVLTSYTIGILTTILSFSGLALWYGMENMGPANTLKLYSMELFPTKFRSTSIGMATSVTRFVSFMSAFEFPFLVLYIGERGFFAFLLIFMIAALIFTVGIVPETRGMTLREIASSRYRKWKVFRRE